ncbi:MAG TPA: sigma-70 family RNA polymerase sigma factor [Dehalococcoidia bacterium]|nr:sigma-70 family RNA polymerase sigma factor [Dehalococcoidia bacterium]
MLRTREGSGAGPRALLRLGFVASQASAIENDSDEALARRFVAGDAAAFEALVGRYSRPIFNFTLRMLGNRDDADDVAQDVFVQIYRSLPRARTDLPFKPWLYVIARNKCLDFLKRRRPLLFTDIEGDDPEGEGMEARIEDTEPLPEELAERADLQRVLQAAIAALPPKYRQVVAMRYAAELSFEEIAASLGLPENTVKTHFHRAKALLRTALSDLDR